VLDTLTGQELVILRGHDAILSRAAFSPDGKHVVTASLATMSQRSPGRLLNLKVRFARDSMPAILAQRPYRAG
jgi:hypothetical protein